jgi:Uncharacterised nucleotidyltransferase
MPLEVREQLARDLRLGTARHLFLSGELAGLLRSFEREKISVIPLKGLALAESLYPHQGIRPSTDLDLLIRPADARRVADLLQPLGYRPVAEEPSIRFDVPYDLATLYEAPSGVYLDLHRTLVSEAGYSWDERAAESVWERAAPIRVAGEAALGLCPEDLLLYLTMHVAVHHSVAGLLWLYDVFLLLECCGYTLDWQTVATRAAAWRVRTAAYFALREVAALFGARVPTAVMAALRPRGPRSAVLTWLQRHRAPAPAKEAAQHIPVGQLIPFLLVDRDRDVVGPVSRLLFPPSQWLQVRYPRAGASRIARYAAHYRRLGEVVRRAMGALRLAPR